MSADKDCIDVLLMHTYILAILIDNMFSSHPITLTYLSCGISYYQKNTVSDVI